MSTSSGDTEKQNGFLDLDDKEVYTAIATKLCNAATKNFVVEFGKDDAKIAYDLSPDFFGKVLKNERVVNKPVRWINIWAPNQQTDLVDAIDEVYDFSKRLAAIIKTAPPKARKSRSYGRSDSGLRKSMQLKDDIERGVKGDTETSSSPIPPGKPRANATHYTIAQQMLHYHSIDAGKRFLCIGANWIHELSKRSEYAGISEGERTTLWSWLLLCDDHTVISIHQDPGESTTLEDLSSIRGNTISVLKQLSSLGRDSADPISIQTVRQALKSSDEEDTAPVGAGIEGASSLFYYLFDDWRAVYSTVGNFQYRLNELEKVIIDTHELKSTTSSIPTNEIIPRLHKLGRQFRQMEHLYKGYKNLIDRVLEHDTPIGHGRVTPRSFTGLSAHVQGVGLAPSAKRRFTRLRDRIELLILSELKEFHDEKSALVDTYFNMTAQKDSEATARLTRAATLLAKLSVLFLPVSLMTAYFSIQIKELEGVYTAKDYWYSFAVIMTISVLGLFFFAKSLMWLTETLDDKMKMVQKTVRRAFVGKKKREEEDEDDSG